MKCINLKHPEFISLVNTTGLNEHLVSLHVTMWMEKNNTDDFPSAKELLDYIQEKYSSKKINDNSEEENKIDYDFNSSPSLENPFAARDRITKQLATVKNRFIPEGNYNKLKQFVINYNKTSPVGKLEIIPSYGSYYVKASYKKTNSVSNTTQQQAEESREIKEAKALQERNLKYFNADEALFFQETGGEDIDYMIPEAGSRLQDTEKVRKARIYKELALAKKELRKAEDPRLIKIWSSKLEELREKKANADQRTDLAEKLSAYEDVVAYAESQLSEIESILSNPNITIEDLLYAKRISNLWIQAGDFSKKGNSHFLLDEDEINTPEIVDLFRGLRARAEDNSRNIYEKLEKEIIGFIQQNTDSSVTKEEVYKLITDSTKINALVSGINRHDDAILQAIHAAVEKANIIAEQEASEIWKKLDTLEKKLKGKVSKDFKEYQQLDSFGRPTGRLVDIFSDEFYKTRASFYEEINKLKRKGAPKASISKALKAQHDWLIANTVNFDPRLLFEESSFPDGGIVPDHFKFNKYKIDPDKKAAHIKELKEHIGESRYEAYYEKAKKKIEKFLLKRDAQYLKLQADNPSLSITEIDALFETWNREYSPYWISEMHENFEARKNPSGGFYNPKNIAENLENIPKRSIKGKPTNWYDKNFEKIEQDADMAEFYTFFKETLKTLKYILPEKEGAIMGQGVIPFVTKNLIDIWSESGLKMGARPFLDKFKEMNTTQDHSTIITSDIDPGTNAVQKQIAVKNVVDIKEKIREKRKIALIEFKQKNGRAANGAEIKEIVSKITEEVNKEQSWDLIKILKAYSLNILSYKHQSEINAYVEASRELFTEKQEISTNKAGQAKKRYNKSGETHTEAGLHNLISALDYFLDEAHYKTGGKKVQGISKTKTYTKSERAEKKKLEEMLEIAKASGTEAEIKIIQNKLDGLGRYRALSEVGDTALKYNTIRALGWNLRSAFSNIGFGYITNRIQASDGRLYSSKNFTKASLLVLNSVARNASFNLYQNQGGTGYKIRSLMDKYNLLQTQNKELFETNNNNSFKTLKRLAPFNAQERSEYLNQAPIMVAIMMDFTAKNEKGEDVSYWEAIDDNGVLKEGYTSDVDEVRLIQKIKRVIEMNHGDYSNPLQVKQTIEGRALSQFRTWMFEGFKVRFESEKPDYLLSYGQDKTYIRKGRYRSYSKGQLTVTAATLGTLVLPGLGTAVGAAIGAAAGKFSTNIQTKDGNEIGLLEDTLFTLKQLSRKLLLQKTKFGDKFTEVDSANMRANMTELYFAVALALVALGLKALADDDEEKDPVLNFLINQTVRLETDIGFYTNPLEFEKLTKTSLAIASLVSDVSKVTKDVVDYLDDDDTNDVFTTGAFKGQNKLGTHVSKLIPLGSQYVSMKNYVEKVFEN